MADRKRKDSAARDDQEHERESYPVQWDNPEVDAQGTPTPEFIFGLNGVAQGSSAMGGPAAGSGALAANADLDLGGDDDGPSDSRLAESVADHLAARGDLNVSGIRVTAREGRVILDGTVSEERHIHVAEEAAAQVPGVRELHSRLRVDRNVL